ncbi:hypothetical protein ABEB36_012385 [Hypothenemus hampei]|uniref:Phospholipid/glycerol acyltransferase domain-containing protein n=1 Tax=Hypothenemus hampei TaxID=57062 RepID=A0ABD1EB67_HYPHA
MVDYLIKNPENSYDRNLSLTQSNDTLATLTSLKRFSKDQKHRKHLSREADALARDRLLFHIKENAPEVQPTRRRPFMGLSCQNCTSASRESLVKKTTENLALIDILRHNVPNSCNFLSSRIFSHLHQVRALKSYSYPQVAHLVLKDDRVKNAVERTALQQFKDSESKEDDFYQKLIKKNQARATQLVSDMRSTLSDFLLRFTSWILYKLLPCFLTSVVVHPGQVHMLKEASKSGLPLIFLPLHRSHLDYILLSFILVNNDIRAPLVAAGDNLRIPFFGSLLRGLGAFFIKRRIDPVMGRKDQVYKAVLHTYMNLCLRAGHNIEFFLEGGRTRTGKPLIPKYGVLSVIVETFMDGTIEDALLVPVSVNYEKLIDGNFVKEQLGEPKKLETFWDAFKGIWHVLNRNYGMMRVDFNQPFSLRELISAFNLTSTSSSSKPSITNRILKSNPSTNSLYGTDVVSDEHKSLVENISKHVLYDCAQSTSIMSTNALAFLLLMKFRIGAKLEDLIVALEELKIDLEFSRKDVGFSGDSIDIINYAASLLGPGLVKNEKDLFIPVTTLPNVIELSYYSNALVTHYALDSVVSLATAYCLSHSNYTSLEEIIENSMDLCTIFQYEFLFCKPCQGLEQVIINCIDDLIIRKEIFLQDNDDELVKKSRKMAAQFENDGYVNDEYVPKTYELRSDKVDTVKYFAQILMPLVETYAIAGWTLRNLVKKQLLENELVEEIVRELKNQLEAQTVHYGESVAVDPIKNSLKLYQKWGVLECQQEYKLKLYSLKEPYDNYESIKMFHEKISRFRLRNDSSE